MESDSNNSGLIGFITILGAIGGSISAIWLWLARIRNKEETKVFKSYKALFEEKIQQLAQEQDLTDLLQDKLTKARIKIAKLEEQLSYVSKRKEET